jgi:tripartite-type tricarboxylate transporter receptor subunit TctC
MWKTRSALAAILAWATRLGLDGYTILFASSSYVVNPSLYPRVPYDPYKDFAPLTVTADAPNILIVHPSVSASTVRELVDLIKTNPGKYSFAHSGIGTTPHLSGEMFKLSAALDLVGVPFNGGAPALQSTMAGHTPILVGSMPSAGPLLKDGKLRALAVAARTRLAALPNVPTLDEAGFKGQEADTFQAMLIQATVPNDISNLLHREIVKVLKLPDVKSRLEGLGFDVVASSQEEFGTQIKEEIVNNPGGQYQSGMNRAGRFEGAVERWRFPVCGKSHPTTPAAGPPCHGASFTGRDREPL